jgi:hypothetical protein
MPESIKELYTFNPDKAKKLLAEAGVPKGFSFKVQVCSCNPDHMDLLPLVSAYLEAVGVKLEIQPMEYAAFLSAMTTKTNAAGYFMNNGHTNPTTTIRKSFVTKEVWNPSQYSDPAFDKKVADMYLERDEAKRQVMIKEMTREILDKAPYIWLPTPYIYTAWWPWVKGYNGELRAGAVRPGPIYARMWVDQDLKKSMGLRLHVSSRCGPRASLSRTGFMSGARAEPNDILRPVGTDKRSNDSHSSASVICRHASVRARHCGRSMACRSTWPPARRWRSWANRARARA